jgi:hypothetical protein
LPLSCAGVADAAGAGRALNDDPGAPNDDPGAPVTGVAAPDAAVGIALSEATGLLEVDVEIPEPGEIWLDALSSVELFAPLWLNSISFSIATTSLELP